MLSVLDLFYLNTSVEVATNKCLYTFDNEEDLKGLNFDLKLILGYIATVNLRRVLIYHHWFYLTS